MVAKLAEENNKEHNIRTYVLCQGISDTYIHIPSLKHQVCIRLTHLQF